MDEMRREMMETIKEEGDRKERERNLIIFNVQESNESAGMEIQERRKTEEIFENGVGVREYKIEQIIRLGRRGERENARPMLVKLENVKQKWEIIKKAKMLKNSESTKHIGIAPDLTKKQREIERRLKNELDEKRRNGETGWYIRRGELHQNTQNNGDFRERH